MHDLAAFGTNQLELAHIPSSLPADVLVNFSRMIANAPGGGMNASLWWQSSTSSAHATELSTLFRRMPKLDTIFFPGGDGGSLNWTAIGLTREAARAAGHQETTIWVSLQGLNGSEFDAVAAALRTPTLRALVDGLVYGPHERLDAAAFSAAVPPTLPIRQYPDLSHPTESQYGLRAWSHVWAYTQQRYAVSPLPVQMARIVRLRAGWTPASGMVGVGGYSEGVADDLNKMLWSLLGAQSDCPTYEAVEAYVRVFLGAECAAADASAALFGLEANWQGDPLDPSVGAAIEGTLQAWQRVEQAAGATERARNWRLQMYLMRAYRDAYSAARYRCERQVEADTLAALDQARTTVGSPAQRIRAALQQASRGAPGACAAANTTLASWRQQVLGLVALLDQTIGGEVVLTQDGELGAQWLEVPLTDLPFLNQSLRAALLLPDQAAQQAVIDSILGWQDPGIGGLYAALGHVGNDSSPVVLPADGGASDPARYHTPSIGGYVHDPSLRISSQRASFVLYDANLTLAFKGLARGAPYSFRARFHRPFHPIAPDDSANWIRLVANGYAIIQEYVFAPSVATYDIDPSLTATGTLNITCNAPPGTGGSGRVCGMSEVWLSMTMGGMGNQTSGRAQRSYPS